MECKKKRENKKGKSIRGQNMFYHNGERALLNRYMVESSVKQ